MPISIHCYPVPDGLVTYKGQSIKCKIREEVNEGPPFFCRGTIINYELRREGNEQVLGKLALMVYPAENAIKIADIARSTELYRNDDYRGIGTTLCYRAIVEILKRECQEKEWRLDLDAIGTSPLFYKSLGFVAVGRELLNAQMNKDVQLGMKYKSYASSNGDSIHMVLTLKIIKENKVWKRYAELWPISSRPDIACDSSKTEQNLEEAKKTQVEQKQRAFVST